MRSTVFKALLKLLIGYTPDFIKCIELQILLNTTAKAFGIKPELIMFHSFKRALKEYAIFTRRCMKNMHVNKESLYREAFHTGTIIRLITGFTRKEDIEALVFYLYSNINIKISGNIPGVLTVSRCYFRRFYKPEHCRIMSAVDSGIIAGINGGGSLSFTRRITEGCESCKACFKINVS